MTVSNVSQSKVASEATAKKHKTIRIVYGDQEADVDKQIAPLIKGMWKAGIETYQSCQDNPAGWVWIQFMSSHELEKFLSIVGDYQAALGSLHDRMRHGYDRVVGPRVGQWRYVVVAHDLAVDEVDTEADGVQEICVGPPDFMILIGVHFPHADYSQVLAQDETFQPPSGPCAESDPNYREY